MKYSDNVQRLLELVEGAANASRMARMIYIENARALVKELEKSEWQQIVKLSKNLNPIQFNMLIAVGLKKPYQGEVLRARL